VIKWRVMGLKSEVNWTRDLILSWLKMIGIELGLIKIEEGINVELDRIGEERIRFEVD
jgi:hypothetical protein